jgi:hypothetical protein
MLPVANQKISFTLSQRQQYDVPIDASPGLTDSKPVTFTKSGFPRVGA